MRTIPSDEKQMIYHKKMNYKSQKDFTSYLGCEGRWGGERKNEDKTRAKKKKSPSSMKYSVS